MHKLYHRSQLRRFRRRAGTSRRFQGALFATCQLFQHSADSSVLVVAARGFAAGITHQKRFGVWRIQLEAFALLVTAAQFIGAWKLGKRPRRAGLAGEGDTVTFLVGLGRIKR